MMTPSRAALLTVFLATAVSWTAVLGQPSASEPLSLERAVALAMASSSDLDAAEARVEAAAAHSQAAASNRWPRIDFEAGVQSTDNPVLVFSQKLLQEGFTEQDFALDRLNAPEMNEDFSARAVARQPLYAGGRIHAGISAANQAEAGFSALQEATRQNLVRSVTELFTQAVIADRRVEVAQKALSTAEAHLELADSLYEGGMAVESDRLLADVRRSEVEAQLLTARAGSKIASAALNLAIGRPADQPSQLDAELPGIEPGDAMAGEPSLELEQRISGAFDQRPDLRALRDFHGASMQKVEVARGAFKPTLGLEVALEAHDPDFFGTSGTNSNLMLGFKLPLFDGGERKAARRRAEAESREAQAEIERLEDQIELDVRSAFYNLDVARQRAVLAESSLSHARRSLEIIEDRYRNGITTLVDLLDAQSALLHSDVRVLDAQRDELLARVALALATGDL